MLWQKKALLHKSFFSLKRGIVMYRLFNYLKHHVYYVSINNIIYYVTVYNFLEQRVYNNMLFMSLILDWVIFWHVIEYLEVSSLNLENKRCL